MKGIMGLLVIVVLVAGGYYFLSRPTSAPAPSPKSSTESSVSSPAAEKETSPAAMVNREIAVAMVGLKFVPTTINVKAGEKVKLNLSSTGPHTFTVDALNINWVLNSGEFQTYDLMVDKKGSYPIYCATPGHKEAGMVGTLVVE